MEKQQVTNTEPAKADDSCYVFHLYITGASPNSSRAVTNLKFFLEEQLKGQYELRIIDVYQQPHVAQTVDIIALPMLVREFPLPRMRLIGDMSNKEKLFRIVRQATYDQ